MNEAPRTPAPAAPSAPGGRPRYLFIRVLEACNADCFMCEFARSRDGYRFSAADMRDTVAQAWPLGVRVVRFTGGEPLLHQDVTELVRIGAHAGMAMSIITNGHRLPRLAGPLAEAGLAQIIVSLDGAGPRTHDVYRGTPGLFESAVEGLRRCRELGVLPRVNTVVGPHNYAQMPQLQRLLEDIGVEQWELSAIKLDRTVRYPDPDDVTARCEPLYDGSRPGALRPLGRRFYGDTDAERSAYFDGGVTPRAEGPACHVTDDVVYLDPKQGRQFACSCLPHRDPDERGSGRATDASGRIWLDQPSFRTHRAHFRAAGPLSCTGCSTTAAGYSDDIARLGTAANWSY
ncbi:cytosylglucuronate decarboxylase [Kitasatospora sp. NPDC059722]|uniref:cytosylglucuronate decarboxylase n=1 Tax=unclassified Kitasatospora TaxID=2633591 RepID=UPI0036B3EE69